MAKSDVKLLGAWASPFVMRVRIALNIKSVNYEFIEEKLGSKSELLIQCNPVYKKIPVLIHEHQPKCESLIIVQYVDEVWSSGPSILPSDPHDRAFDRFWAFYIDQTWFPLLAEVGKAKGQEAKRAAADQAQKGLMVLEDTFRTCSKGRDFFDGDGIGYLDIALGCFLGWLKVSETSDGVKLLDEAKMPGLARWAEKFCAHAAVKDVMPETDQLAEFAKVLAKFKASASPPAS